MLGLHTIDIDTKYWKKVFDNYKKEKAPKLTGKFNLNHFWQVTGEEKDYLNSIFIKLVPNVYWYFETFESRAPVSLHNDKNIKYNDEYDVYDLQMYGVIIPLYWTCKTPYTIFYDKYTPRKLMYKNNEMRYVDTNEIYTYSQDYTYDEAVLSFNPKNTEYYKQYADLKIFDVYEWKVGTAYIFDAGQWHSSSWFLSSNKINEFGNEYKQSINGLASIKTDKDGNPFSN